MGLAVFGAFSLLGDFFREVSRGYSLVLAYFWIKIVEVTPLFGQHLEGCAWN